MSRYSVFVDKTNLILIPHPTKGGNWKLKHSCLESVGVPVFYKYSHQDFVAGGNHIDLPEWYDKLVVPNTSFVMTRSHGHFGLSYGDIVDLSLIHI